MTDPLEAQARTPLEMAGRSFPVPIASLLPKIRCLPVDTNVLLKNIGRDVRQFPQPTGLRLLSQSGALRLYAAPHVLEEVEEKLEEWMAARGHDPKLARRIWEGVYLPLLWIVDPAALASDDPRVQAVAAVDADDTPTAALASVLGVQALSEDRLLAGQGLASGQPWLDIVFATGHVAFGETVDLGIAFGFSVSAQTVGSAYQAVRGAAATPGGKRVLIGASVGCVALIVIVLLICAIDEDRRRWLATTAKAAGHALASGGEVALGAYARVSINRSEGVIRLEAATVGAARPVNYLGQAARLLAVAPQPLTTRELARHIWSYERVPASVAERLRAALLRQPAFVEIAPDTWLFGRPAVDPGPIRLGLRSSPTLG